MSGARGFTLLIAYRIFGLVALGRNVRTILNDNVVNGQWNFWGLINFLALCGTVEYVHNCKGLVRPFELVFVDGVCGDWGCWVRIVLGMYFIRGSVVSIAICNGLSTVAIWGFTSKNFSCHYI